MSRMANHTDHSAQTALMVLSFGGPEKAEDVVPFLENVTRGRGIPRERLEQVGEHYFTLGGRSPINDQNRALIANIEAVLANRGVDIPVYFGNRNWEPYVEPTLVQMVRDGVREVYVFATSAWGGYSGCAQYQEDIDRALRACDEAGLERPLVRRLPQFHNHPEFIAAFADAVDRAVENLPESVRGEADLVFSAHSVPNAADAAAGPEAFGGNLYSQQVWDASRLVQAASSFAGRPGSAAGISWTGRVAAGESELVGGRADGPANSGEQVELVWQSRSGSPHTPWLEPDVCDHIEARAESGNLRPIVLCPIGFITDHIEVVWDLDTEAREAAEGAGIPFVRVDTPGLTPRFAGMVVDLFEELRDDTRSAAVAEFAAQYASDVKGLSTVPNYGSTRNGQRCAPGCCASHP